MATHPGHGSVPGGGRRATEVLGPMSLEAKTAGGGGVRRSSVSLRLIHEGRFENLQLR